MEPHALLVDLKSNVEVLLSANTTNIWSMYGRLKRLTSSVENILNHRLKYTQEVNRYSSLDYLNFVKSLYWLDATLIPSADKIKTTASQEDIEEGQAWIRLSLLSHTLSSQLKTLISDHNNLLSHYYDDAFICRSDYFQSLCLCLQAIEQNNPTLLTNINHSLLIKTPAADSELYSGPDPLSEVIPTRVGLKRSSSQTSSMSQISHRSGVIFTLTDTNKVRNDDNGFADMLDENTVDFSDSPHDEGRSSPKGKQPKHKGHKRSKSDMLAFKNQILSAVSTDEIDILSTSLPDEEELKQRIKNATVNTAKRANPFEGYFPQPRRGETLKGFLSSTDFDTCAELDRENAHFAISEALIAAIEYMKWNQVLRPIDKSDIFSHDDTDAESDEEIVRLKQKIQERREQRANSKKLSSTGASKSRSGTGSLSAKSSSHAGSVRESGTDSMFSDEDWMFSDTDSLKTLKDGVLLKPDRVSVDSGSEMRGLSADQVALALLNNFKEESMPDASQLPWLVSEHDAPQKLLPLPTSQPVNPDDMSGGYLGTRIRGNVEWAPPRAQIIFHLHPHQRKRDLLSRQNYRCAGCGTRIDSADVKRLRLCDYLGKYFCQCCHVNKKTIIPARVLQRWDVGEYPVSNFSYDHIQRISDEPLFNVEDINPSLKGRSNTLQRCTDLRRQLQSLKLFISTCKLADEGGLYKKMLELPSHMFDDLYLYTLNELCLIKTRVLDKKMKDYVVPFIQHIETCELCMQKGFVCELCNNGEDVIFPYQLNKIFKCPKCQSCYHQRCFSKLLPPECPKCVRVYRR